MKPAAFYYKIKALCSWFLLLLLIINKCISFKINIFIKTTWTEAPTSNSLKINKSVILESLWKNLQIYQNEAKKPDEMIIDEVSVHLFISYIKVITCFCGPLNKLNYFISVESHELWIVSIPVDSHYEPNSSGSVWFILIWFHVFLFRL